MTISRFCLSTPACRGKPFQIHGSGFVLFSGADSWRGDTNASGMYPRISGDGHDRRYTPVAGPLRHQIPTAKSRVSARTPRRMGAPAAMVVPELPSLWLRLRQLSLSKWAILCQSTKNWYRPHRGVEPLDSVRKKVRNPNKTMRNAHSRRLGRGLTYQ